MHANQFNSCQQARHTVLPATHSIHLARVGNIKLVQLQCTVHPQSASAVTDSYGGLQQPVPSTQQEATYSAFSAQYNISSFRQKASPRFIKPRRLAASAVYAAALPMLLWVGMVSVVAASIGRAQQHPYVASRSRQPAQNR